MQQTLLPPKKWIFVKGSTNLQKNGFSIQKRKKTFAIFHNKQRLFRIKKQYDLSPVEIMKLIGIYYHTPYHSEISEKYPKLVKRIKKKSSRQKSEKKIGRNPYKQKKTPPILERKKGMNIVRKSFRIRKSKDFFDPAGYKSEKDFDGCAFYQS